MNGENFMKTSEETTAYWKQRVQTFQKSGLSRIAHCEQNPEHSDAFLGQDLHFCVVQLSSRTRIDANALLRKISRALAPTLQQIGFLC